MAEAVCNQQKKFTLAVHGGAGSWTQTIDDDAPYRQLITAVLRRGEEMLRAGASSLDVCTAAVAALEDSGLLNAGRGAVANSLGACELDAAVMEGSARRAGAVAGVSQLKNPIAAARLVMTNSPHVLLVGRGAEQFARQHGAEAIDPTTYYRRCSHAVLPHGGELPEASPHGTVGAVAMDRCGQLAAATSTGGYQGKLPGRVGDSPVIGAGTYAEDAYAALSATGHGEYFMRFAVTYDVIARMKYLGLSLAEASEQVVKHELPALGGEGGLIGVDRLGQVSWPFNSKGMLRGSVKEDGQLSVAIY